jgi:serine/threonine-protein kinase RIO1
VFKTTLNEFSHRSEYIDADPRYKALRFNKQSDRAKFTLWAKKEMRNLLRMHRAGTIQAFDS